MAVFETFHSGQAQRLLEAVRNVTDKPGQTMVANSLG